MERLKIGESSSTIVIEVSPSQLRDLASAMESRLKVSGMGSSIIIPISNSVSVLYNVPIKESWQPLNNYVSHITGQEHVN